MVIVATTGATWSHASPYTVGTQLTVGSSASQNLVIDRTSGTAQLSDAVTIRLDLTYAHVLKQRGDVFQALAAATWDLDDHWSVNVIAGIAPPTVTRSAIAVLLATPDGSPLPATADLKSRAWTANGEALVEYDTAGDGTTSTTVGVGVGARLLSSTQTIQGIASQDGTITSLTQLAMTCAAQTCSPEIASLLDRAGFRLGQLYAVADVTETLWRATDLDVATTVYTYTADPLKSGVFGLSSVGSDAGTTGLPVVPLRFSLAPAVTHRFGHQLSVTASSQYGRCVDGHCWTLFGGTKARLRIGDAWRVTLAVAAQRDATVGSPVVWSRSIAIGGSYAF